MLTWGHAHGVCGDGTAAGGVVASASAREPLAILQDSAQALDELLECDLPARRRFRGYTCLFNGIQRLTNQAVSALNLRGGTCACRFQRVCHNCTRDLGAVPSSVVPRDRQLALARRVRQQAHRTAHRNSTNVGCHGRVFSVLFPSCQAVEASSHFHGTSRVLGHPALVFLIPPAATRQYTTGGLHLARTPWVVVAGAQR